MDIDILEILITFLGSAAGIGFIVFVYKMVGKYVKTTDNKVDDILYELLPDAADSIISNYDAEEAENILDKILEKLKNKDKDTTILEKKVEEQKDKIKK